LRMFSFNDSVNLCLFVSSGTGTVGNWFRNDCSALSTSKS
jgi:hypothetical protein